MVGEVEPRGIGCSQGLGVQNHHLETVFLFGRIRLVIGPAVEVVVESLAWFVATSAVSAFEQDSA
jgi:hypothetical protein